MYAGQRLIASDGYEVCLFPLDDMYLTQGEYGSTSHVLAMDFQGWSNGQRVYQCPYYAPCTLKCVDNTFYWPIFESTNKVHWPDGSLDYVTICFMHDDVTRWNVGDIIAQGDFIGRSGTAGNYGDHVHINTSRGLGNTLSVPTPYPGFYELTNSTHIYDTMYVNDTILTVDGGYNWRVYTGPTPPPPVTTPKKKKFPWWLLQNRKNVRGYKAIT